MTRWRVKPPHLCAGLVARGGTVVEVAPLLRWAVGKPLADVLVWLNRQGGEIELLGQAAGSGGVFDRAAIGPVRGRAWLC
jgi:hypothetical protein